MGEPDDDPLFLILRLGDPGIVGIAGVLMPLAPVRQNEVVQGGAVPGADPEFRFIAERAALPLPEDLIAVDDAVRSFHGILRRIMAQDGIATAAEQGAG